LRAVAVIPVLLFHAGLGGFSGGFLGVDVFFVISGFLITSILVREAEEGRFSIVAFYNRRVRRIFPALFAMLGIVTVAAALILAPSAFSRYARSLIATTLFSSNILFWKQTGYFDTSALEKPLLHTWSLAVEEQFYLVWPLILGTLFRFGWKQYLLPLLCAGVALSFALAVAWPDKMAVFYLPVTRAWELGLGAILAVRPTSLPRWASLAGIGAIVVAIMCFNEQMPLFIASGVACLGTAALICTEGGIGNRALSWAPCVGIGLISYSLYLWHWPLLAFAHYLNSGVPPVTVTLPLLGLAGLIAYLSYKYVETPFRKPGKPWKAFGLSGAVMTSLVGVGVTVSLFAGFPLRYGAEAAKAEKAIRFGMPRACDGCTVGDPPAQVVLWGDSYARPLTPTVQAYARENGLSAIIFTRNACPSLSGAARAGGGDCVAFQHHVAGRLEKLHPKLIILASRWSISSETTRFGTEVGPRYFLTDGKVEVRTVAQSRQVLHDSLFRTVAMLHSSHPGALILLVGQVPELGYDAERCMIAEVNGGQCSTVPREALPRIAFGNRLLAEIASRVPNVRAVYLGKAQCKGDVCPTRINGTFLYQDPAHLSATGAALLLRPYLLRLRLPQ
jgi:peptidoglycan/LPS O-acetylase OafA/YrhL